MKNPFVLVAAFLLAIVMLSFASNDRATVYKPQIFKKSVAIMPTTTAMPDSNAWLQIGDADSSTKAHIRFPNWTDTSKLRAAGHQVRGAVIFSYRDSSLWIYTGSRWKKVGS